MSEFKDLLPYGMFIITIGGLVGGFFKAKGMDEVQQRNIDEKLSELHLIDEKQWLAIDFSKKWQIDHEKEAAENRLSLELKISKHDGDMNVLSQQLNSIEAKLDSLIREVKNGHA